MAARLGCTQCKGVAAFRVYTVQGCRQPSVFTQCRGVGSIQGAHLHNALNAGVEALFRVNNVLNAGVEASFRVHNALNAGVEALFRVHNALNAGVKALFRVHNALNAGVDILLCF